MIAQSPGAGAELREGATVKLTVSTGPTRSPSPTSRGSTRTSATSSSSNAGFEVGVIDESIEDPAQDGVVVRQTPAGGSDAAGRGSVITLTVGRLD